MSRTRAVLIASLLFSALALGGCSGSDPEPKFAPPSSSAPSSPSSSAAPALGPDETVRAWIDARNLALDSGDLTNVHGLTSPMCTSCAGILDPISQVYDKGGRFDTDGWRVVASRIKSEKASRATVSTGLEFAAGETVPKAGAKPVVYEAEKHIVIFKLTKVDGDWVISFVGFLS